MCAQPHCLGTGASPSPGWRSVCAEDSRASEDLRTDLSASRSAVPCSEALS